MEISIRAPYFGNPSPAGASGKAFWKLWDYEVVEAFFLGDGDRYLELEFGPHGQHLALLLDGKHNIIKKSMDVEYNTQIGRLIYVSLDPIYRMNK
jgi:hypothetical protein